MRRWTKTPIADMARRGLSDDLVPVADHVIELPVELTFDDEETVDALAIVDARGVTVLLDGAAVAAPHGVVGAGAIVCLTTAKAPVRFGALRDIGLDYVLPGCDPRAAVTL